MPAVSIVIPVYNVDAYLCQCVESVRQQTLADIEIVCVNDGSPDSSAHLLALYEQVEPRVKVVTKPNGGLSSARNAGIAAATGDIVCFLDSDDFMEPNCCQRLVDAFREEAAELITFGAWPCPRHIDHTWHNDVLTTADVSYPEYHPDLILKEKSYPFVWRTACARGFLERTNLLFDEEARFGEDTIFQLAAYPRAKGVALISDRLINYRLVREGSLMTTVADGNAKQSEEHLAIAGKVLADWKAQGLIDEYPAEGLDWANLFLVAHLLQAERDRDELLDQAAALLRAVFPESLLVQRAEADAGIRAVVYDHALAAERSTLWSHYANRYGITEEEAAKSDQEAQNAREGLGRRLRTRATKVLPAPAASRAVYERDFAWEKQEKADRLAALDKLLAEVARMGE